MLSKTAKCRRKVSKRPVIVPDVQNGSGKSPLEILDISFSPAFSPKELMTYFRPDSGFLVRNPKSHRNVHASAPCFLGPLGRRRMPRSCAFARGGPERPARGGVNGPSAPREPKVGPGVQVTRRGRSPHHLHPDSGCCGPASLGDLSAGVGAGGRELARSGEKRPA